MQVIGKLYLIEDAYLGEGMHSNDGAFIYLTLKQVLMESQEIWIGLDQSLVVKAIFHLFKHKEQAFFLFFDLIRH